MTTAQGIKRLREKYGLTQSDLGDIAGLSSKAVGAWEAGRAEPRIGAIERIAAHFAITKSEVLGWDREDDDPDFSGIKNLRLPDAYSVPILGRICCGDGTFTEDSYDGFFVLDKSIRADFCLEARGDSMTDAGIDDGDKVFIRKSEHYEDGKIYGIIIKGEDLASLKKVYRINDQIMLQPCNAEYHPQIVAKEDVFIVGEYVGVFKTAK